MMKRLTVRVVHHWRLKATWHQPSYRTRSDCHAQTHAMDFNFITHIRKVIIIIIDRAYRALNQIQRKLKAQKQKCYKTANTLGAFTKHTLRCAHVNKHSLLSCHKSTPHTNFNIYHRNHMIYDFS